MSPFDFESIPDRRGTHSVKWHRCQETGRLPMWVADMDFPTAPCIEKAVRDRASHALYGYTRPPRELNAVVANRFRERYDAPIETDWIHWVPGVVPGLSAACLAFAEKGDEVVILTPVYPPFRTLPGRVGRTVREVPLKREGGRYTPDAAAFRAALTPRTRLFFLCQPHNPVGRAFARKELMPLLDLCLERDILIVSDEIHGDLILDDLPHRPVLGWSRELAEHTLTLMSPGKTFNTAGLNAAFAVIPNPAWRTAYRRVCETLLPHPNPIGLEAALAAYREGEPWRQALLEVLRANARRVLEFVERRGHALSMDPVEATYLAWIDASRLGTDDPARLFREGGVIVSPGRDFGDPSFVRLNFGCPPAMLNDALNRMSAAIETGRGNGT
jgi:cysteine-S-conjugate beta-lyase